MKDRIAVLVATMSLVVFCICSCKKGDSIVAPVKQEVTFSFEQNDLNAGSAKSLKLSYLKEDAKYVVVSIEKSNGEKVYESKRLEFYNFGGSLISQSLSLEVDGTPYKLTQFLVLNENYNVIFATPLEGSALAYLVADPLPVSFTVSKDQSIKVVVEVLSTELVPVKDFGYASFSFNVVMTQIRFLLNVQVYNPLTKNWEGTTANVFIRGYPDNTILYNDSIRAITDTIKVPDGYVDYEILISKAGYKYIKTDTTLTSAQLKAFWNKPLLVLLKNEMGQVSDIDGNVYHTVTIGTQVWMVENLKTTKYRNGDPILNVTDNSAWASLTSGAFCWYNNDAASYKSAYGALYNGFSVSDSRNIAPAGWHIATEAEYITLTNYLGGTDVAGGKLKEAGSAYWLSPNSGATNESGFSAFPGSIRNVYGTFGVDIVSTGEWWLKTVSDANNTFYFRLSYASNAVTKNSGWNTIGLSVRCIMD